MATASGGRQQGCGAWATGPGRLAEASRSAIPSRSDGDVRGAFLRPTREPPPSIFRGTHGRRRSADLAQRRRGGGVAEERPTVSSDAGRRHAGRYSPRRPSPPPRIRFSGCGPLPPSRNRAGHHILLLLLLFLTLLLSSISSRTAPSISPLLRPLPPTPLTSLCFACVTESATVDVGALGSYFIQKGPSSQTRRNPVGPITCRGLDSLGGIPSRRAPTREPLRSRALYEIFPDVPRSTHRRPVRDPCVSVAEPILWVSPLSITVTCPFSDLSNPCEPNSFGPANSKNDRLSVSLRSGSVKDTQEGGVRGHPRRGGRPETGFGPLTSPSAPRQDAPRVVHEKSVSGAGELSFT